MDYTANLETYFSGKTFPHDEARDFTVIGAKAEEVGRNKEIRPVLLFKEDPRKLILNKTSYAKIAKAHKGQRDTDKWIGAVITISYDPDVTFGGQVVGGLKVAVKKAAPAVVTAEAK